MLNEALGRLWSHQLVPLQLSDQAGPQINPPVLKQQGLTGDGGAYLFITLLLSHQDFCAFVLFISVKEEGD